MSAILFDDKIVHYEVLGRGRPIIFLHGWVGSWRYWVPTMQVAATAFRTYALDLWGFGDTSKNPQGYSLEQQSDLLARFMHEMGLSKIALVGHGLGALVGAVFARRFPEMVDRMLMADLPLNNAAVSPRLRALASPADLADWLLSREPSAEPVRADASKADPMAITASLNNLETLDFMPIMDSMTIPCLIVHGQNDPAIQTPEYERILMMSDYVHQVILDASGHFPMLDEGPKFNRLMTDFLALLTGESPRQLQLKEEWKRRVR